MKPVTSNIPSKGSAFLRLEPAYWRLNKTLYGLSRRPKNRYEKIPVALQELLVPHHHSYWFEWIGPSLFVIDFAFFSESDEQMARFEAAMNERLSVYFSGPLNYFLGCCYEWIENALLDRFGVTNIKSSANSFRRGGSVVCTSLDTSSTEFA